MLEFSKDIETALPMSAEFVLACASGDEQNVNEILEIPIENEHKSRAALYHATINGHENVVKRLLCDPYIYIHDLASDNSKIIYAAIFHKQYRVANLLLSSLTKDGIKEAMKYNWGSFVNFDSKYKFLFKSAELILVCLIMLHNDLNVQQSSDRDNLIRILRNVLPDCYKNIDFKAPLSFLIENNRPMALVVASFLADGQTLQSLLVDFDSDKMPKLPGIDNAPLYFAAITGKMENVTILLQTYDIWIRASINSNLILFETIQHDQLAIANHLLDIDKNAHIKRGVFDFVFGTPKAALENKDCHYLDIERRTLSLILAIKKILKVGILEHEHEKDKSRLLNYLVDMTYRFNVSIYSYLSGSEKDALSKYILPEICVVEESEAQTSFTPSYSSLNCGPASSSTTMPFNDIDEHFSTVEELQHNFTRLEV